MSCPRAEPRESQRRTKTRTTCELSLQIIKTPHVTNDEEPEAADRLAFFLLDQEEPESPDPFGLLAFFWLAFQQATTPRIILLSWTRIDLNRSR